MSRKTRRHQAEAHRTRTAAFRHHRGKKLPRH